MTRFFVLYAVLFSLSACGDGTNPFMEDDSGASITTTPEDTTTDTDGTTTDTTTLAETTPADTGTSIDSDSTFLPGTSSPSASSAIFRREAQVGDTGNGFAENFAYDAATDTFTVDNLAFDGTGPYTAVLNPDGTNFGFGTAASGRFNVYQNQATAVDGLTLANVSQLTYRALYGIGPDGNTSIAIVRTGAYIEYGFGGYIFQRNGSVTMPETGQAQYTGTGNYAGLRDFTGGGGLEYVSGDISVSIDFNDFNAGAGVDGFVRNRSVFDLAGNDVTSAITTGLGVTSLPVMRFVIEPGVLDSNGEMTGEIQSVNNATGEIFEEGNYYAVLSGDNAQTITGIIVVTGDDPRRADVDFRETAGFFASRQ